jgi:antirestriction protein ArdC
MSDTIYNLITESITKKLEAGVCPWKMPWAKMAGNEPHNIKGNRYNGANFFILSMLGFSDPCFLTFKQAQALGGTVRKGEKGIPVVFWKMMEKVEDGKKKNIPMIRYYTVFNISQCDGVKYVAPEVPVKPEFQGIEAADNIVKGFKNGPSVNHGGNRACYSKATDSVQVPHKGQFNSEEEYYSTLFHELGHSTGHPSRLNRKELCADEFGTELYSTEELTAELTAAFLCAEAGINATLDNSAAYIGSWLKKLKADPKAFITAAGKAQKAANLITGKTYAKAEEAETSAA